MKQVVWENDCAQKFIKTILLPIIYFIYFAIINPSLHGIQFTKRRFVLTWVFFWFPVIVRKVYCVYFTVLAVLIPVSLCILVCTSLFTCVAIFVVARKRMLKRNEVHSNSDRDSRENLMVFLRQLNMAWWFSAVFVGTTILNKEEIGC